MKNKSIEEKIDLLIKEVLDIKNNLIAKGYITDDRNDDELFEDVKNEVLITKKASASYLQRRFQLGYARACRLLDQLEEEGVVGPTNGAKPREVFGKK